MSFFEIFASKDKKLFKACEKGDLKKIKKLIKSGANVNYKGDDGITPLYFTKKIEISKLLIDAGANVNEKNNWDWSPIHLVNDIDITKLLIENGADVNVKDNDGMTPLHWITNSNNYDKAKLLIEKGAEINVVNNIGATPLDIAMAKDRIEIAKLLIENDAKFDTKDIKKNNLFKNALKEVGNNSLQSLLYEIEEIANDKWQRFDKPFKDYISGTFIMSLFPKIVIDEIAIPFNKVLMLSKVKHIKNEELQKIKPVDLEIFSKAFNVPDKPEISQHFRAVMIQIDTLKKTLHDVNIDNISNQQDIFELITNGDLLSIKQLFEENDNLLSTRGLKGMKPLHAATIGFQKTIVKYLLEKGAQVNIQKDDGWTSLHHACQNGDADIANLLISNGADIEILTKGGLTPLHAAAYGLSEKTKRVLQDNWKNTNLKDIPIISNDKVIHLLIDHGAEIEKTEPKHGATALHLAIFQGQEAVVKALLDCGANIQVKSKGSTPLHLAAGHCYEDIVRLLIDKGADINVPDDKGRLPHEIIGSGCELCDPTVKANLEKLLSPFK